MSKNVDGITLESLGLNMSDACTLNLYAFDKRSMIISDRKGTVTILDLEKAENIAADLSHNSNEIVELVYNDGEKSYYYMSREIKGVKFKK